MAKKDKKKYGFSEAMAIKVGFEEAVMFSNIHFWVNLNERNEDEYHFHKGKYWTFNSILSFAEQYPFWTVSMIKRILKNLEKAEYIETGVFNKFGPDKTKWYTVTQKGIDVVKNDKGVAEIDKWISEN